MNILQNVKSGFANFKELFGILLSDEKEEENNYDLYINGDDRSLALVAKELKEIEEEQETKRLSLFGIKNKVEKKTKHAK